MPYPNDMSRLAQGVANYSASKTDMTAAASIAGRNLIRRTYVLRKEAVDGAAGTLTAYTAADQITMARACKVLGFRVQPRGTLTAADATAAVVNVVKGDGLGGAAVICATLTTNVASGDWVVGASKAGALSATAADTRIPAGGVLGFSIAKTSTGTAVPICSICVDVEEEGTDGYV